MFESVEHLGLAVALVASLFGLVRGVGAWRKEREMAHSARIVNEQLLQQVLDQFKPNHGTSLADRVDAIATSVEQHHAHADQWFRDNADAHAEIHRRIDGLLELLAGPHAAQARKLADWHKQRSTEEE